MKYEPLSEKVVHLKEDEVLNGEVYIFGRQDVKEAVERAEKRLKVRIEHYTITRENGRKDIEAVGWLIKDIDKIWKEEFGRFE